MDLVEWDLEWMWRVGLFGDHIVVVDAFLMRFEYTVVVEMES